MIMAQTKTDSKRGLGKRTEKILIHFISQKENVKKEEVKKCIRKTK